MPVSVSVVKNMASVLTDSISWQAPAGAFSDGSVYFLSLTLSWSSSWCLKHSPCYGSPVSVMTRGQVTSHSVQQSWFFPNPKEWDMIWILWLLVNPDIPLVHSAFKECWLHKAWAFMHVGQSKYVPGLLVKVCNKLIFFLQSNIQTLYTMIYNCSYSLYMWNTVQIFRSIWMSR